MAETKVPPVPQLVTNKRCVDALNEMININAIKHRKIKIAGEDCCYSLLSFKRIRIHFISLIITLLIFAIGSQSAISQCAGLCTYEWNSPQNKIPAAGVDEGYREYAKDYFGSDNMTEVNRDLSVSDVQGESIKHNSSIFASNRISVSQGLSDEFALNEMDSTGSAGEDLGGGLYAANDAGANSNPQTSKSKDWEFTLVPYVWFTALNGSIVVKGISANVDASFFDLAKYLSFALMLHGEAWWKGKFGAFEDTVYARLEDKKDVTIRNFSSLNIKLIATIFIQEIGGLYQVGTWPVGSPYNSFVQKAEPSFRLDLLAGGRFWHLGNELDISGQSRLGILPSEIDQSKNWFDFIVGARGRLDFYKKLYLEVRSDIGGFNLSFSSKIAWNTVAALAYETSWHNITPLVGYRALYDDYSHGSGNDQFKYKAWMHGPVIGVAFKF
jgi:hypothetical protein